MMRPTAMWSASSFATPRLNSTRLSEIPPRVSLRHMQKRGSRWAASLPKMSPSLAATQPGRARSTTVIFCNFLGLVNSSSSVPLCRRPLLSLCPTPPSPKQNSPRQHACTRASLPGAIPHFCCLVFGEPVVAVAPVRGDCQQQKFGGQIPWRWR